MEEMAAIERYVKLLDLLYNKIDIVNADIGSEVLRLRVVRGVGNVVELCGKELASFGHFDADGLLVAYYIVTGVRECTWALVRSGNMFLVDLVEVA